MSGCDFCGGETCVGCCDTCFSPDCPRNQVEGCRNSPAYQEAWRAKWGSMTRAQAETHIAHLAAMLAEQMACAHHWHAGDAVVRQAIKAGATETPVFCCHCAVSATRRQSYERFTPEGCGKYYEAYRALPPTYDIKYTTVPTIDP